MSQTAPIDLLIPMEVQSQNVTQRWHWRKRKNEVDMWVCWLRNAVRSGGIGPAENKRHVRIIAYRKRLIHDEANLVGGCKGPIDALVRVGLLVDDSTQWMKAEYEQALAKCSPTPGKVCTRIIITEMEK